MKNQKKSLNFIIGATLLGVLSLILVISLFYTPYEVTQMDITNKLSGPTWQHWMGTDNFGRDILSRLMEGSQTAFLVGFISVAIGLVFGVLLGSIAGYYGHIIDEFIMRIVDAMMSFPGILFALMFVAVFGVGIRNTMIALGIMTIPSFARISRSTFLEIKNLSYVNMAKCIGVSTPRIIFVHMLPNVISSLIIAATMGFSGAILSEAGLSYLGLGVQPPHPSWGRMLSESQVYLMKAPFYAIAPGIVITLAVLGFNLLGDGIRDLRELKR